MEGKKKDSEWHPVFTDSEWCPRGKARRKAAGRGVQNKRHAMVCKEKERVCVMGGKEDTDRGTSDGGSGQERHCLRQEGRMLSDTDWVRSEIERHA